MTSWIFTGGKEYCERVKVSIGRTKRRKEQRKGKKIKYGYK